MFKVRLPVRDKASFEEVNAARARIEGYELGREYFEPLDAVFPDGFYFVFCSTREEAETLVAQHNKQWS